jgi:GAF domain-containing protein
VRAIRPANEFALVPLNTGDRALGVLYADNKFTGQTITIEQFELLQTFVNQAALVLENAQALEKEREQTRVLSELLKVEEAIHDQVTKSVKELLAEIVRSACRLLDADCAVLYPLRPGMGQGRYFYEIEHIICSGTRLAVNPTDKPRSREGMAAWVIQKGRIHVPDVAKAALSPDGRKMSASPFISRESIRAFVAVRLGPREEPVGILYINWRSPHLLTEEELTIVEVYANFVAVAIPSARRHQQVGDTLRRRTQELYELSQVFVASLAFRSEGEVEEAIKQTLQTARGCTGAHYVHLVRNEPYGLWQAFRLTSRGELLSELQETAPAGISREAFVRAESQLVQDANLLETNRFPDRHHPDSRSGLAVPVKATRHCQAVLYLESHEPYGLNVYYQELLERLVSRLAFTLEQAELYQALRQLLDISLKLTQEISLETALVFVVEQAMDAMRSVDAITLYYVEAESGELVLGHMVGVLYESDVNRYPLRLGTVVEQVWESDAPIFAENVAENEMLYGPFVQREGIKSTAAFPLKAREERVGCMFFNYRFEHAFDEGEKSVLNLFAQWAAFAILRVILYDEAERRRQRLETVARITPIISANLKLDDVFRAILSGVKEAVPLAQNACIVERDETTQDLLISPVNLEFYRVDQPPPQGRSYRAAAAGRQGIAGRVIRSGEPEIVPNVQADPDYISAIASTSSELCVPVQIGGKTQAALVLESDQSNAFTVDDERLLATLADHVAIAIQNVRRSELIREREMRERIASLATGLIHDINSAIANIPDLVKEIERKSRWGRDINAPLADLRKSAEETDRISNRIRDFIVAGQFNSRLIKVRPLIEKAIDVTRGQRPDYVIIQYDPRGLDPEIEADGLWIELLLRNLISNAQDAILPDGGIVEVEVEVDAANVFIRVKDNGKGIAPENLPRIFDAEYTTKDQSRLHGIGLYYCKQVVEVHHGKLEVDSTPGVGTVFTVTLPRVSSTAVK